MAVRLFHPAVIGDVVTTPTNSTAHVIRVDGSAPYDTVLVEHRLTGGGTYWRQTWRQRQLIVQPQTFLGRAR